MTEKVGSVIYVSRTPTVFATHWDGETWCSRLGQDRTQTTLNLEEATPEQTTLYQKDVMSTFAVSADPKNLENRLRTAREWASGVYYNRWSREVAPPAPRETTRDNKPFAIQIVGLDIRGEGGRAYKVVDNEGHMFDLREDVAFEALMEDGCLPGGYMNCQFLWGVVRNNMKLIRNGSLLHQALERATGRRIASVIPFTQLKPGFLYRNARLDAKWFLGWVPAPRTSNKYKMVWASFYLGSPTNLREELANRSKTYGPAFLDVTISTEHTMVEEIADNSDCLDLLMQCAHNALDNSLQHTIENEKYYKQSSGREVAAWKRQIKELGSIIHELEVSIDAKS